MKLIKLLFLVIIILVVFVDLYAVQQEFKFNKLDFKYRKISAQKTTVVGFDKSKLSRLGKISDWGMIETHYSSTPKWANDVEIKYYVLMKEETPKKPVMLTGSVTYILVQEGREHASTMYIPPQATIRYGEVSRIRAELWYNGILQNTIQWPRTAGKTTPWWTRVKPTYGAIFNRYYTPFEHETETWEEVIKIE